MTMSRARPFSFARTARDGGVIRLDGRPVAEVRRLALVDFAPVPGAPALVGREVGVPLYWRQYANHQDPERSLDSHRRLAGPETGPGWLRLRATSATRSRCALSKFEVVFRADARGRVTLTVRARLEIPAGRGWRVTPQADHGELAFCTLWPAGVFSPAGNEPKRFQACLVQRGARVEKIAHHHLESPDKQRLKLGPGDRFAWVLEEWNPVVTLGPGTRAEAGICAYMWDTHFGLRVGQGADATVLPPGTVHTATYSLGALGRAAARRLLRRAGLRSPGAAAATPVYTGGRHDFHATFRCADIDRNTAWPWQRAITRGDPAAVELARETRAGCGDRYSLRIRHRAAALSAWQATTLGPAFGEPAFRRGGRLRLRAMVRTRGVRGKVRIALRVHRAGRGSVFDVAGYEVFSSPMVSAADQDWCELTVTTPALSPAPDRVHLLLELDGVGCAWFDEVELERLS
jgi:hypothetical protein